MKNKPKKKLKAVPIHERVELIPGQSVKQKMIREKRRKAQKSTLLDRVKAEDEMVERANELRKATASEANEDGVYSITYKPDEERQRRQNGRAGLRRKLKKKFEKKIYYNCTAKIDLLTGVSLLLLVVVVLDIYREVRYEYYYYDGDESIYYTYI